MSRASPLRVADYLQHILEAVDNIQDYTSGMDLAAFMADRKTCDAVIRNLEVIGEACNNVAKNHPAFVAENSEVPRVLPTKCVTHCHMDISPWTTSSFGRLFSKTCQN